MVGTDLSPGVISPQDWGISVAKNLSNEVIVALGVSLAELEARAHAATYDWLLGQLDAEAGESNQVIPWQLMAAYDRYQDAQLLEIAERAAAWFYQHHVESHPASLVAGGVRITAHPGEIETAHTAEAVITFHGLYARGGGVAWLERAVQSGCLLIQARRHGFAPRHMHAEGWSPRGRDSWGRVVEANLLLWDATGDANWLDEAIRWGEHALEIQAEDGAFYLIDGDYYSSELAADEIRAMAMLCEATGQPRFLWPATRFADWHIQVQSEDGAWPLTIDRDGNIFMHTVRPGDVAEIAVALLRLYHSTHDADYLKGATRALCYALGQQALSGEDDENVRWGFWAWEPRHDDTLSAEQCAQHTRAMWFFVDYQTAFIDSLEGANNT